MKYLLFFAVLMLFHLLVYVINTEVAPMTTGDLALALLVYRMVDDFDTI